jgi:hemolysin activation/secretion protein
MQISLLTSRHACGALLALSLVGIAGHAWAQNVPDTVNQSLPGLIYQQNVSPEALHTVPSQPKLKAAPEPEIDRSDMNGESADPSLSQKFFVRTIEVQGEKHLPDNQVQGLLHQYEGRQVSFLELRELTEKLTDLYRQAGYVTSLVYIGPQKIENGHIVLKASEGILGRAVFENGKYFKSRAIMPRVAMTDGKAFQLNDLRRSLRRINENPDIKVRATLSPGELPEQTNVELEATEEHMPFHLTPFMDNMGRNAVGTMRFGLTSTHNNLLGFGDQAFNTVVWSRYSFGTITHYGIPVGKHGTTLNFNNAYSTLTVNPKMFHNQDNGRFGGTAKIYSPSISQELVNRDNMKLSADVAFDFMNVVSYWKDRPHADDHHVLSNDRLRVLRPGINFDAFDRYGRTMMRHEFGIGLDLFNATLNTPDWQASGHKAGSSRKGAGSQFFRYTANITRLQKMPFGTYAILRASTQLTPNMLVSAQQYQLGGAYTVRGYHQGTFIGDNAYFFSGEWRVPFFFLPKSWHIPKTDYKLRDNLQLVSFLDYGATFTHAPAAGVNRRNYALGTGVGIRANLTKYLAGRLDLGIPLMWDRGQSISPPYYSQAPRVHFGLESRLF